jgi:hypothetical protein
MMRKVEKRLPGAVGVIKQPTAIQSAAQSNISGATVRSFRCNCEKCGAPLLGTKAATEQTEAASTKDQGKSIYTKLTM